MHEVKSAFPECVAAHCGHPIVCWKYATPSGIQLSNERTTMLHAHQLQHRPCNCCNMPAKYKDESGHVVTTDLSIIDHSQNHPDMRLQILMTLRTCSTPSDHSYRVYVVLFCVILLTTIGSCIACLFFFAKTTALNWKAGTMLLLGGSNSCGGLRFYCAIRVRVRISAPVMYTPCPLPPGDKRCI